VRARLRRRYGYVSVAVLGEPKGLSSRVPDDRLCLPAPMHGELPCLHQALPRRFSGLRYCLRARIRKPELGRRYGPGIIVRGFLFNAGAAHVRLGSKADVTPHEPPMSALPAKADIRLIAQQVRKVPVANMRTNI
jgi:hypothetical protein